MSFKPWPIPFFFKKLEFKNAFYASASYFKKKTRQHYFLYVAYNIFSFTDNIYVEKQGLCYFTWRMDNI